MVKGKGEKTTDQAMQGSSKFKSFFFFFSEYGKEGKNITKNVIIHSTIGPASNIELKKKKITHIVYYYLSCDIGHVI